MLKKFKEREGLEKEREWKMRKRRGEEAKRCSVWSDEKKKKREKKEDRKKVK